MNKINWLDHIANLLVVILGISIAFYLESYKEEKASEKQEAQYVESLIKDLETDLDALDTLKSLNKMMSKALIRLSNAATGGSYDQDSLGGYMLILQYNPPLSPQTTTYESLKSSGKMDLISDFDLRNSVIELYEQYYRGTRQYDEAIDLNLRDFFKPFFFKNVVFENRFRVDDKFLSETEFRNIIFAYRFLFLSKTEFYNTVSEKLEEILGELKAYRNTI